MKMCFKEKKDAFFFIFVRAKLDIRKLTIYCKFTDIKNNKKID